MTDRLPMPSAMPAELAERLSDQPVDVTDATEDEAITAILDNYLSIGDMYPRTGGRRCVSAGEVVADYADFEDVENMLSALVYDGRDGLALERAQERARDILKAHGPDYLRTKYPDLIERMQEEMSGEEA